MAQDRCPNFDLDEFQAKFGLTDSSRRIKVDKESSLEEVFDEWHAPEVGPSTLLPSEYINTLSSLSETSTPLV